MVPAGFLDQPTRTGFATHIDVPVGAAPDTLHRVPFTVTLTGHLFDEPRLIAIGTALERQLAVARARPQPRVGGSAV